MSECECGCRCHASMGSCTLCCPECEPEAYDDCESCNMPRYAHNDGEREGTPGACEKFRPEVFVPDVHTIKLPGFE